MKFTFFFLMFSKPLTSFFLSNDYMKDLNDKSPTKGAVAISFANLLSDISKVRSGARINPQQFQKAVSLFMCIRGS